MTEQLPEIKRLRQRIADLEKALTPFARESYSWSRSANQNEKVHPRWLIQGRSQAAAFRLADLRRAEELVPAEVKSNWVRTL